MSTEMAASSDVAGSIGPDVVVGGRFLIEKLHREDPLGVTYLARDQKTQKPIAIRVLSESFAGERGVFEQVRDEVKAAAKTKHRSLVGTYGVGTHGGASHFVACEWVRGTQLSDFVRRRKEADKPLSVRGAYNVIAHVAKALTTVHEGSFHGALRPGVVWVTKSGRVKVSDLGLAKAMVQTGRWALLDEQEQAFLAPEVKAGAPAGPRSDIFGLGALLYVLLTGRSPTDDFLPPSQAHPDASPLLDDILLKCLAVDPGSRYATAAEVSQALMPLAADSPEPEGEEFGVDMEIDVDIAMSLAPPAQPAAAPAGPPPVVFANQAPPSQGLPAPPPPRAPSRPDPLAAAPVMAPPAPPPAPAPSADFAGIMEELTKNDAPRWMAVKDGLDHGPFTARELVKLIVDGEIREEHSLLNMDTSERKPLGEYPQFSEFVAQYKIRKAEQDHAHALEKSTKVEKRGNVAKMAILAASIGAVLIGGGAYLMSREAAKERTETADVDLAAMFESGRVKITGTAGILKYAPRKGAKRSGGSSTGGGSKGGFSSYDDAMNQAVEMNMGKSGGERQLTSADVAGVMNRKLNTLFGCVSQELRRGGRLGTVQIDLAIQGSGRVMGASVNAGSGAFKRCIQGKVRSVQFPSFPAPRMGARYSFDVN